MKILMKSAIAAAVVAIATPAFASTITLSGLSTGLGRTVQTNVTSGTYHAGQLTWNVSAMTGNAGALTGLSVGDTVSTFCTELAQLAGAPTVFNVVDVEDAPQPGSGMGELRATYINTLYSNYYAHAFESNTSAAAFQLAVWEIVHEADAALNNATLDANAGAFQVTGGTAMNIEGGQAMSAVAMANSWLTTLAGILSSDDATMFALTNVDVQDQLILTSVIPLPAPLLLGGLGLAMVPVLRRRFSA